jgi:mono/diheme cytochrome c family protein
MLKPIAIASLLSVLPVTTLAEGEPMSKGAYIARLGDCTSCHTEPGGKPFAGGFKVNSPFGIIYGTNITPDPEYGIGDYSLEDFTRAVRQGIRKDGKYMYPAMPYPSFAKMTDEDVKALYDYFMHEVLPVHEKSPETRLPFPFNQRWGIGLWNFAFTKNERYRPQPERDAKWNRGAYLVQSLGHCGACHTPRGLTYEQKGNASSSTFLSGGVLDNWYAANLSANNASGLGRWSEKDIADFLATGHGAGTVAFGSMKEVVENSSQHMTPEDRAAIAHYLKSLESSGERASYNPDVKADSFEHPGAGLYANFCANCHQLGGTGKLPRIPKLAGNSIVLSPDATSIIRIVLEGSISPQTKDGPKPAKMPGFAKRFTDQEIADVVTFIRQSWGNNAPPATKRDVRKLRERLAKQQESAETIPAQSPPARQ